MSGDACADDNNLVYTRQSGSAAVADAQAGGPAFPLSSSSPLMSPWSFDLDLVWQPADDSLLGSLLKALHPRTDIVSFELPKDVAVRSARLPFLREHQLVCLTRPGDAGTKHCFLLHGSRSLVLDGTSDPIHTINHTEGVRLAPELRGAFLRFFCAFVYGSEGPFQIIEDPAALRDLPAEDGGVHPKQELLDRVRSLARPLAAQLDSAGDSHFETLIVYGAQAFIADMRVDEKATVEMVSDEEIGRGLPGEVLSARPVPLKLDVFLPELADAYREAGLLLEQSRQASGLGAGHGGSGSSPLLDRDITRVYVMELLRHALKKQKRHTLLDRFNAGSAKELDRFSRFVLSAWPVVAIESNLPFAEELIAEMIGSYSGGGKVKTHYADTSRDDGMLRVEVPPHGMVVLPLGTYPGVVDVERVAHRIAIGEIAALIGCYRFTSLPDALRKAVDLVLRLPDLDEAMFRSLFQKIFRQPLPRGWRRGGSQWVRYLLPTDLHQPSKLGLKGMAIVRYLRARVEDRLRLVAPIPGPALEDLHGLIEAKQVAQDLIADVAAAQQGRIPWAAVDRGMLLVGPPGTGKTSLARAVAKSCGIRFVTASAAAWQSAGHLGDHLRAMRASFTEARRYAPAILFIDEIDSIGNRENMRGDNGQYHTQVVNGLLELLQGIDEEAPVIVLAATNFAERVDPALRRAGRLDRIASIPYPNVDALCAIFDYYLADRSIVTERADDVDVKALGAMAFGLTGADVESFVRGAARRARKANRPLAQVDLLAEITGKPRHPEGAGRLTPEDMRIVAVHEAGHALARVLGREGFGSVAFVSIVPRGDGTLGFVAPTPSAHRVLNRAQYHDLLEVILAGRAAEDLVFGEMGITGGAGGPSQRSDLAVATQVATELTCLQGMGKSGGLVWSGTPDSAQQTEIAYVLRERYSAIMQRLATHRQALDALVAALLQHQELTGAQLQAAIEPLVPVK